MLQANSFSTYFISSIKLIFSILIAREFYPYFLQLSWIILKKTTLLYDFYNSEMMIHFLDKFYFILAIVLITILSFSSSFLTMLIHYCYYLFWGFSLGIVVMLAKIIFYPSSLNYYLHFEYYGYIYITYMAYLSSFPPKKRLH